MRNIYNFTPHPINETIEGVEYPSIGNIRITTKRVPDSVNPLLFFTTLDDVQGWEGLKEIAECSIILVSMRTKKGMEHAYATDTELGRCLEQKQFTFVSPGELVRDHEGKVIGCKGFDV